jgi:hypothetical protein
MDESDRAFLALVESGEVEPFGHREHLWLALLAVRATRTLDEATAFCRAGIRAVAAAQGMPGKYHERFYSAERLGCPAARHERLAPDRAPLP